MVKPWQNNKMFTTKIVGLIVFTLLESGCQPTSTSDNQSASSVSPTNVSNGYPNPAFIANNNLTQNSRQPLPQSPPSDAENMTRRLEIVYARNAAYKKDQCPKLIEFENLNQTVSREGEQLTTEYCEYFVFLAKGDTLSVHTSNDMQAELISPIWFDFRKGSFTADKYDKYTIRLNYDGVRYHPANFHYDIRLIKNGGKPD